MYLFCVCGVRLHFFIRVKLSKASARTGHMAVLAARCPTFPWAPPLLAGAQGPPAAALVKKKTFSLKHPEMPNFPLGAAADLVPILFPRSPTLPCGARAPRTLKRAPARRLGGKNVVRGGGSHPCTDRTDAAMCGLNLSRS